MTRSAIFDLPPGSYRYTVTFDVDRAGGRPARGETSILDVSHNGASVYTSGPDYNDSFFGHVVDLIVFGVPSADGPGRFVDPFGDGIFTYVISGPDPIGPDHVLPYFARRIGPAELARRAG